jgi:ubiquinone/menaquinone biosynthesis C-methylase UbiE
VKAYYEARAPEYDDWWHWHVDEHPEEYAALVETLAGLSPAKTLDVACGTGFLTRHLPGAITGIDQSRSVLEIAAEQAPNAELVHGEGLELPFADGSFERVFTSHFYGHLEEEERSRFLVEARRLAPELVLVDAARRPETPRVLMQERVLKDGSRWAVLKRYFTSKTLLEELGGGRVLYDGEYFLVVQSP